MGTQEFLKSVESRGWMVETFDGKHCIARCKSPGCSLRIQMEVGKHVPIREVDQSHLLDHVLHEYNDARKVLRDRREDLGISIAELEEVAGIAKDHLAKFEPDGYRKHNRVPNIEIFLWWANSLGYEVVLRPKELPPITCRAIAETRHLWKARNGVRQRRRRRGVPQDHEASE